MTSSKKVQTTTHKINESERLTFLQIYLQRYTALMERENAAISVITAAFGDITRMKSEELLLLMEFLKINGVDVNAPKQ